MPPDGQERPNSSSGVDIGGERRLGRQVSGVGGWVKKGLAEEEERERERVEKKTIFWMNIEHRFTCENVFLKTTERLGVCLRSLCVLH